MHITIDSMPMFSTLMNAMEVIILKFYLCLRVKIQYGPERTSKMAAGTHKITNIPITVTVLVIGSYMWALYHVFNHGGYNGIYIFTI